MRTLLALIWREIVSYRLALLLAMLLGWVPLVVPHLSFSQRFDPDEIRDLTALALFLAFGFCLASLLGAQLLTRDLAEQRLAFFYSRPIGVVGYFIAKITSAFVLLGFSGQLLLLPCQWLGGKPIQNLGNWPLPFTWATRAIPPLPPWGLDLIHFAGPTATTRTDTELWFWVVGTFLATLLLSHLAALVVRIRSSWALVDIVLVPTFLLLAFALFGQLSTHMAYIGQRTLWTRLVLAFLVSAGASVWVGLAQGRTVPERVHRFGSSTFWLLFFGLTLLSSWSLIRPLGRSTPSDLAEVTHVRQAPKGDWLILAGPVEGSSGYYPALLTHPEKGQSVTLGPLPRIHGAPTFSHDGHLVTWSLCSRDSQRKMSCLLQWSDLRNSPESAESTSPILHPLSKLFNSEFLIFPRALHSGSRRLALAYAGTLAIYDLPTGALIHSVRLPIESSQLDLHFLDPDHLRLVLRDRTQGPSIQVWDLSIPGRTLMQIGEMQGKRFRIDWPQNRILVWSDTTDHVEVYDDQGRSQLFSLPRKEHWWPMEARTLPSGAIVLASGRVQKPGQVTIFDSQGQSLHDLSFPEANLVILGGEPAPGRLLLGLRQKERLSRNDLSFFERRVGPLEHWETRVLDVSSAQTLDRFPGTLPLWHTVDGAPSNTLLGEKGQPLALESQGTRRVNDLPQGSD